MKILGSPVAGIQVIYWFDPISKKDMALAVTQDVLEQFHSTIDKFLWEEDTKIHNENIKQKS